VVNCYQGIALSADNMKLSQYRIIDIIESDMILFSCIFVFL